MARLLSVGLTDFSLNADAAENAGPSPYPLVLVYPKHVGTAQNFVDFRT